MFHFDIQLCGELKAVADPMFQRTRFEDLWQTSGGASAEMSRMKSYPAESVKTMLLLLKQDRLSPLANSLLSIHVRHLVVITVDLSKG